MATAVAEGTWRESSPERVERDLAGLWRDLAGGGAIARAVMSNLIVFRLHDRRVARRDPAAAHANEIVDAVGRVLARHPSRAVVIEHDRGNHAPCKPIDAKVGVSVFGPPAAQYAVEWVVVRSACAEASLPSIVRRFIRGDLPTSVWWMEDMSRVPPMPALVATGRQLLYDSRRWHDVGAGIRAVSPLLADDRTHLADLNWRRLAPLRLALGHAVGSSLSAIPARAVQIAHRPGEAALAWLLAGWLAARLRWPSHEWPLMSEVLSDPENLENPEDLGNLENPTNFENPANPANPGVNAVLSLRITDASLALTATLDHRQARLEQPGTPPLVVAAPRHADADTVAGELRTLSRETDLHDAVTALSIGVIRDLGIGIRDDR